MNQTTIRVIESVFSVRFSRTILNCAASEFAARATRVKHARTFTENGLELCFQTVLCLMEQLYRRQAYTDVFAHYISGQFGLKLSTMLARKCLQRNGASGGDDNRKTIDEYRTHYERVIRVSNHIDLIHETAIATAFNAADGLVCVIPSRMGQHSERGSLRWVRDEKTGKRIPSAEKVYSTWQNYYCVDIATRREIHFASQMSTQEKAQLCAIIAHNQSCVDVNEWRYIVVPTTQIDRVGTMFNDKNILTVRYLGVALRHRVDNCVFAMFRAAVTRFIKLEYGYADRIDSMITEDRESRINRRNSDDMLPMMFQDAIEAKCNALQKIILQANMETFSPEDCLALVNCRLAKPIHRAAFYRHLKVLREIAKDVSRD